MLGWVGESQKHGDGTEAAAQALAAAGDDSPAATGDQAATAFQDGASRAGSRGDRAKPAPRATRRSRGYPGGEVDRGSFAGGGYRGGRARNGSPGSGNRSRNQSRRRWTAGDRLGGVPQQLPVHRSDDHLQPRQPDGRRVSLLRNQPGAKRGPGRIPLD